MPGSFIDFRQDLISKATELSGRVAVIDGASGHQYSYADLLDHLNRVGAALTECGLQAGDRVVSCLPNSIEQVFAFLASIGMGLDFIPLSPQTTEPELDTMARLLKPRLILLPSTADMQFYEGAGDRSIGVRLNGEFDWAPAVTSPLFQRDCPAGRLFVATSGSTGAPKLMGFDPNRLWASGRAFMAHLGLDQSDLRFLNNLPQSYLGGLFNLAIIPLATGGSTVVTESFSGRTFLKFWRQVEQFDVTAIWLTPTILRGLIKIGNRTDADRRLAEASDIRAALVGTAPIDLESKQAFETMFGVELLENYALSETTFLTSESSGEQRRRTEGSVGSALPYVKLALRNADHVSGVGEIVVKTPYMFLGYFDGSELAPPTLNSEGYFATGDLGRIDDAGSLTLTGRLRDFIKKGGYMLLLREIELTAEGHPDVVESAAIPIPHEFYGEDYVLQIRLRDQKANKPEFPVSFRSWMSERLAAYKLPGDIMVVEDFMRTESGKVAKANAAKALSGSTS